MKKRILAVILCVAMLLSVMPFTLTASAAPADDNKVMFSANDDEDGKLYYTGYTYGINGLGYAQPGFLKESNGVKYTSGDGSAYLFADEIDGEKMWKFDFNVDQNGNHVKSGGGGTFIFPFYSAVKENGNAIPNDDIECLEDNYADAAEYTHLAIRIKFVDDGSGNYKPGSTQPFSINLLDAANGDGAYGTWNNKGGVYFYDVNTGEKIPVNKNCMQLPLGFDGYLIFHKNAVAGTNKTLADLVKVHIFLHWNCTHTSPSKDASNSWVGTEFYVGDMILTKNIESFNLVYAAPAFDVTSGDKSITVISDDANAVYSLNENAGANEWLAKDAFNATLTNLTPDTKYTVYAKYATGTKIISKEVWTSPYATHKGDGASYFLNVYDDYSTYTHLSYNPAISSSGTRDSGWPNETYPYFVKDANGAYTKSSSGRLPLKEIDGETFIEFDKNEAARTGGYCANQGVNVNAITYNGSIKNVNGATADALGLHSSIDRTNLTHVAIRVKIEDVGELNGQRSSFSIYLTGTKREQNLTDAYLIDKATGAVIDPKWEENRDKVCFSFTDEFDGWIVFPMSAWNSSTTDGKLRWTAESSGMTLYFHGTQCNSSSFHSEDNSNWDNRIFYLGDVVVFGDEGLFKSVHVCEAAGHVEGTEATCKTKATCSVCNQPYGNFNPAKHGTNTELRGVVIADCQQPGYTGDTWCKDCETKIADGTPVQQGTCADKDGKWETDGTYHWHTCTCGAILDKATHSGGTATCTDLAVCEICQVGYGELDEDNHCDKDAEYEFDADEHFYTCECGDTFGNAKHEGGTATCKDQAICKVCKQPYGEKNAENHVGETEVKDIVAAECGKEGFTGNTYCKDCGVKIKDGEKIEATGNHTAAEELKDAAEATTTKPGYTGDKVCKDCGFVMEKGEVIPTLTDDTNNNEGQTPGGSDDEQTPGGSDDEQTPGDGDNAGTGEDGDGDNAGAGDGNEGSASPDTGDNASILVAVLMVLMAGAVLALSKKRAQSK